MTSRPERDPDAVALASSSLLGDPGSLIAILWGGRRLIAAGLAAALALSGVYLALAARVYQATAKVLVIEQGSAPLVTAAGSGSTRLIEGAEDSIASHAMILSSPVVLRRAIETIGVDRLTSLRAANLDAAVRLVSEGLSVTRPDRLARVLQVSYRSTSRDEAGRVVQAVVDSYQGFLGEVYARGNGEVVQLMTRARDDLSRELRELEEKYLEFRRNSPVVAVSATGKTIVGERIEEWGRAARDAMVRAVQLRNQLELGRALEKEGVGLWSIAYAMDQVGVGPGGQGQGLAARVQGNGTAPPTDYLRQLATEQQRLAETLGAGSTKVKEIQEQMQEAQVNARATRGRIEQGEVDDLLTSVGRSLASLERMRGELQKEFDTDLELAKKAEIDQLAETNLKNELERRRTLFNSVVSQLEQATLVGDYPGTRAQVIEPPNVLVKPVQPRVSLTLVLAVAAGGMLGLASVMVVELVAPRMRSAVEVRRLLGLSVLGEAPFVPELQRPPSGLIALIGHELPRSPSAEAYRVVKANLDLARRGRDVRVIIVTAPHRGAGASTVAGNLAAALAQPGRKAVLVDANLRAPSQHAAFDLPRERGLAQVLRGLVKPSRVIRPTRVPDLDLLPSGPEVTDPTELLSASAMTELLVELRSSYETIVVDAPPLLGFADTSVLGASADGMVLVLRMGETHRSDAVQAVEVLEGLGNPVLGAVLSGTASERRGPRWRSWTDPPAPRGERETSHAAIPYDPRLMVPTAAPASWPPADRLFQPAPWTDPAEGGVS